MRVTVSEELKKYRPLTIWQIINRLLILLFPYIVGAMVGLYESFFWTLLAFSLALLIRALFFPEHRFLSLFLDYRRCNRDGYWVILSKDPQGNISATGPVLSSAMGGNDGYIRTLSRGDGLHIVLPLNNKETGYVIIGEISGSAHLASLDSLSAAISLAGWRFEPTHLFIGTTNGELAVMRIIDPSGTRSEPKSLSAVMRMVGGFTRQMMEARTFCDVADILLADKTQLEARVVRVEADKTSLEKELVESEAEFKTRFDKAMTAFANTINAIGETKRFVKSKEGERVRLEALQSYLRVVGINEELIALVGKPDELEKALAERRSRIEGQKATS